MDDYFVGYLRGTLDPATQRRVDAWLACHPEAGAELARMQEVLSPLAEDADPEPPPGLVAATLTRIAAHRAALERAPSPSRAEVPPRRWARRIDWVVAASLLILAGGLSASWLAKHWRAQERVACENNLRQFWVGLEVYGDRRSGEFPRVEAAGARAVAGIFVPTLNDCGLLGDVSVGCPARGRRAPCAATVAELERLYRDRPELFRRRAADLAGDYAYSLGYRDNGRHRGLRRDSGDGLPIMADAAGECGTSSNHGCAGQNVLYVGGNVRWTTVPTVGLDGDDIYHNQQQLIEAGLCRSDTVLAGSDRRPYTQE